MNLNLFHFGPNADDPRNWKMKDKLNGWIGRRQCLFLEWSGWYSFDLAERLLGHYRLFKLFKKSTQPSYLLENRRQESQIHRADGPQSHSSIFPFLLFTLPSCNGQNLTTNTPYYELALLFYRTLDDPRPR